MAITIRQSTIGTAESLGGVGGYVQQGGQTNIYVRGQLVVTVEAVTASVIISEYHHTDGYVERVTDAVPVDARYDYDQTVAWWLEFLTNREAARAAAPASTVIVRGGAVVAPGFTAESLERHAMRGKAANLRTRPSSSHGVVMVSDRRHKGWYAVTRTSCTCRGHQGHGYCLHRAYAIWLSDLEGYDICRVATIGVDEAGRPVAQPGRELAAA